MNLKTGILSTVAAIGLLCVGTAFAEDYAFQGFATADAMNQMHAAMRDNMMSSGTGSPSPDRRSAPRAKVVPKGGLVLTTYRPSPAVSRRVRSQFAEFVGKNSGAEAAQRVRSVLANGDRLAAGPVSHGLTACAPVTLWTLWPPIG